MNKKVFVVLVTYNPEMGKLIKCVNSLKEQVEKIIIVDNTPSNNKKFNFKENDNIEIIYLYNNYGIAYAQNIGINKAINYGAEFILTSDQDTLYPDNYIEKMLEEYYRYSNSMRIAAIAPIFKDINSNSIIKVCEKNKNKIKVINQQEIFLKEIFIVSHVISSGMLIPVNVFNNIGLMNDRYFIDWVDTEWCFRALVKNYIIIQSPKIIINHNLGDKSKKILNYKITIHNNIRKYYRVRNAVYMLLHENNLKYYMKKYIFISLVKMIISHFYFSEIRYKEIYNKYLAIKDAVINNMGKYNHSKTIL